MEVSFRQNKENTSSGYLLVSILVLMEVSFRPNNDVQDRFILSRFNPCFNGSIFQTAIASSNEHETHVSILVLMEVSFRQQVVTTEKEVVYTWFQSLF